MNLLYSVNIFSPIRPPAFQKDSLNLKLRPICLPLKRIRSKKPQNTKIEQLLIFDFRKIILQELK